MPRTFAPAKKDATQPAIEAALAAAGFSLCDTHALGVGAPDLFAAKDGVTIAIECKTGRRKRRPHQIEFARLWQGEYLWGSDPADILTRALDIVRRARTTTI